MLPYNTSSTPVTLSHPKRNVVGDNSTQVGVADTSSSEVSGTWGGGIGATVQWPPPVVR
jgi:hypothetical protein